MDEVFQAITHFPGLIPSILLGVVLILGLLAVIGLLDLDHVGPEWHIDFNHDGHTEATPDFLVSLGLGGVPFYVVLSSVSLCWWVLTSAAQIYVLQWLPLPIWLSGSVVLVLAFVFALPLAAMLIQPMKPLFARRGESARPIDFIGRPCKILTGTVDERFGQAEVILEAGAHHNIKVYARTPNGLARGHGALILSFDAKLDRFEVEAYDAPII